MKIELFNDCKMMGCQSFYLTPGIGFYKCGKPTYLFGIQFSWLCWTVEWTILDNDK